MTEDDWLTCDDPRAMLDYLWDHWRSERKERLVACAAVRRVWGLLPDDRSREAVEAAERHADGVGRAEDFAFLCRAAEEAVGEHHDSRPGEDGHFAAWKAAHEAAEAAASCATPFEVEVGGLMRRDPVGEALFCAAEAAMLTAWSTQHERPDLPAPTSCDPVGEIGPAQSAIIRDIFGNPFRPVTFDPRWRTADVMALARGIYEERAFERMPLLADALMDAGCADEPILGHCRSDGPHVRGCWVVDLVLAKE